MNLNGRHMDGDVVVSLLKCPDGQEDAYGNHDPHQDVSEGCGAFFGLGFWIMFHFFPSGGGFSFKTPMIKSKNCAPVRKGASAVMAGKRQKKRF
jgi:hypothetical protein